MADAAKSGVSKLSKLSRVRVVEEGDLDTDKESLFASAAGSVVLVKQIKEGVERLTRLGKGGKGGGAEEGGAGGAPDDPYSFIVPVSGTADASKVHVNSKEELQHAANQAHGSVRGCPFPHTRAHPRTQAQAPAPLRPHTFRPPARDRYRRGTAAVL
jgi:hypothetical protein